MFPSTMLSAPPLLLFFAGFVAIYLTAYFVVFRSWAPHLRPEAASCAISLFHGTPVAILAAYTIAAAGDPAPTLGSANTPPQELVLDYSVAYFLADLLHYLAFYPRDLVFIGHHLVTLFVFLTCRFLVLRGAYAVLVLLVLAEVTSLCQNVWTLARARRGDSEAARRVYDALSVPFYAVYSVVRGVIGPWFVWRMVRFYWAENGGATAVPGWAWVSWVVVVVTAIAVSWVWISNLWVELYRERKKKLEAKLR